MRRAVLQRAALPADGEGHACREQWGVPRSSAKPPPDAPPAVPVPAPSMPEDRTGAAPPSGPTRVGTAPHAPQSSPAGEGRDLPAPHERDEAAGHVAEANDPVIEQARRDLDRGLLDTDLRTTPGLDAEGRERLLESERARARERAARDAAREARPRELKPPGGA